MLSCLKYENVSFGMEKKKRLTKTKKLIKTV